MSRRALIVSIERYDAPGVEPLLPGTDRGALLFREWLIHTRGFAPSSIVACAGEGFEWRAAGTTRAEILAAVAGLRASGTTEELHVFVSGQGFAQGPREPAEQLVTSDGSLLSLSELASSLQAALRPVRQHWLLDCRVRVRADVPASSLCQPPPAGHRYVVASTDHQASWPRVIGSFAQLCVRPRLQPAEPYEGHGFVTFDLLGGLARHGTTEAPSGLCLEVRPLATQGCGELEVDARSASSGARYAPTGWRHGFEDRVYRFVALPCPCLGTAVASPRPAAALVEPRSAPA